MKVVSFMKNILLENIDYIMNEFYSIGEIEGENGVTRLGYSEVEDEMHNKFMELAHEFGLKTEVDDVGNSYAYIGAYDKYYLLGSHLDSVVNAGRYDGIVGVAVGLAIMKLLVDQGKDLPVKTVAFRCEESANFMSALMGSGLITGTIKFEDVKDFKSRDGITLGEIFEKKGYSTDPKLIDGVIDFIELHIEQGRVLEENKNEIGIVNVVSGGIKISVEVEGIAEHAGATPMNLRADSLAAVGEIILEVERLAKKETKTSVGTVGYIENYPNAMNVVPGKTKFSIDLRDISNESMGSLQEKVLKSIKKICKKRNLSYRTKITGKTPAAHLSKRLITKFSNIAKEENYKYEIMPSGASHDCLNMNKLFSSILIFIPCKEGISHNPLEFAKNEDIALGGELILKYLLRESNLF